METALYALYPKPLLIVSRLLSTGHTVAEVEDAVQNSSITIIVGAAAIRTELVMAGNRPISVVPLQTAIRWIVVMAAQDIAILLQIIHFLCSLNT